MLDIDWNAPKTPCKNEWCNHPNYHVCIKPGTPDLFPQLLGEMIRKNKKGPWNKGLKGYKVGPRTQDHIDNITASQRERWERVREQNRHRDENIVSEYAKGGLSIKDLEIAFGISRNAVRAVLHRAQEAGLVVIRPVGVTKAYDKGSRKVA